MRKREPHKAIGLYAHITWHTRWRVRSITRQGARHVVDAVRDAAARCRVRVHAVGVLTDHVHVVVSFSPDTTLSSFIRESKSSSSLRINQSAASSGEFHWCRGYYANTICRSHVAVARRYVERQYQRHPQLIPT